MLLEEILSYIEETVNLADFPAHAEATDVVSGKLYDILQLEQTHTTLKLRTTDMKKNITGARPYSALLESCSLPGRRRCHGIRPC